MTGVQTCALPIFSTSDEDLIRQHNDILQAIKNHEDDLARGLIKEHYSISCHICLTILEIINLLFKWVIDYFKPLIYNLFLLGEEKYDDQRKNRQNQ